MGLFRKVEATGSRGSPDDRLFAVYVVGESHYQAALERLCGGRCSDGYNIETAAVLVANPDNPYDSNAVEVRISDDLVGHLARDVAANVSPVLLKKSPPQSRAVFARITGGWDRGNGDVGYFGVQLSMPQPHLL